MENRKNLFIFALGIFILLMGLATVFDLSLSQNLINYNSLFGTVFQTFGGFPKFFLLILVGQIALNYGMRITDNVLFKICLIAGGFSLSGWQLRGNQKEIESYILAWVNNVKNHKEIGLANSDTTAAGHSLMTLEQSFLIWGIVLVILTVIFQFFLNQKDDDTIRRLLIVGVFAALTVWFALEIKETLKVLWGRVRPYELNASHTNFTPWYHINGATGHKSFPSGHTVSGTLAIVFSWFISPKSKWHQRFWLGGIIYAILLGISRIIIGGHFLSDVTMSFFMVSAIIFVMRKVYLKTLRNEDLL